MKLTIIIIFATFTISWSQPNSVYSKFGLGLNEYSNSARNAGMGDLGVSVLDRDYISTINPALWGTINLTRAEFTQNFTASFTGNESSTNYKGNSYFGGFSLAFPVSTDYGATVALGLSRSSIVSYNFSENGVFPPSNQGTGIPYQLDYEGEGGLSRLFLGSSINLPLGFISGASLDFYIGQFNYISEIKAGNTNYAGGEFVNTSNIKGISGSFGLITPNLLEKFELVEGQDFRIGVSLNLDAKLTGDSLFYKNTGGFEDTVSNGDRSVNVPGRFLIGVAYKPNDNVSVYADFLSQNWANYSENSITLPYFQSSMKLSAGIEYIPSKRFGTDRELYAYRAGISYEKTPFLVKGEELNQLSISLGFSYLISTANSLDFALKYSKIGKTSNNLISEHNFRFVVSLNIGELWFIRSDRF